MTNRHPQDTRRKRSLLKMASYAVFAVGGIVLVSVLGLLLFHDSFVNRLIKPRIVDAFTEKYPTYSIRISDMNYSLTKNTFQCDSVVLSAVDGTFSSTLGPFSVSGIDWMHLLWGGSLSPHDFAGSVVDANDIVLNFRQSQYELRCGLLRISVPDSEITVDALDIHPAVDDHHFFAESKFRKTRFNLTTDQCRLTGVACLEAMSGKKYRARSLRVQDLYLDILINKDKPAIRDSLMPLMPNEILSLMKESVQCDSLGIINGALKYGERFDIGSEPALITLDSMHVVAEGLANHGDSDAVLVINAQGTFMKAGTVQVRMSIPVSVPEFSFQYAGSVDRMDLRALNMFVEKAEQMRIKEGVLQAAHFEIDVSSGRATGAVRAVYRNLTLAAINKHTGSEKGFVDGLASFIANSFQIRATNVPDRSGAMKIGEVTYTRERNDPFFGFVWFALRSGVGDIVGF